MESAEEHAKIGNHEVAQQYRAESWAVTAEAYWVEGNPTASREAWRKAVENGWIGEAPWRRYPRFEPTKPDTPAALPEPPPQEETDSIWQEERIERVRPFEPLTPGRARRGPRRKALSTFWEHLAATPYRTGRNHSWNSLINIPGLEEARGFPAEYWRARFGMGITTVRFEDNSQGGTTRWKADTLQETIEVDYAVTDTVLVGGRITTGEVFEIDNELITIFDNGTQIVPDGRRSFGIGSLVARGKYVGTDWDFADYGILVELKLPIADKASLLTSQSIDLALSALLTKALDDWILTANGGFVFPIGDADTFGDSKYDGLDPVFHAGVSLGRPLTEEITVAVQVEINTSPFGNIPVIGGSVAGFFASGRYRVSEESAVYAILGRGFGDLASDLMVSGGMDFAF